MQPSRTVKTLFLGFALFYPLYCMKQEKPCLEALMIDLFQVLIFVLPLITEYICGMS